MESESQAGASGARNAFAEKRFSVTHGHKRDRLVCGYEAAARNSDRTVLLVPPFGRLRKGA